MISEMVNSQTVLLTLALEQQHCGVQVVEWVGLVTGLSVPYPSSRLAAVFAEEVGKFGLIAFDGRI